MTAITCDKSLMQIGGALRKKKKVEDVAEVKIYLCLPVRVSLYIYKSPGDAAAASPIAIHLPNNG